jgi:hypothetical protein
MFRRTPEPAPKTAPREAIEITLQDLATLERVLLEADRLRRTWLHSSQYGGTQTADIMALLYQRAGAASVVQPDPQRARIPFYRTEFQWLADAIASMETHYARRGELDDARQLLNKFNALLGRARAITHMGGTAVFDPDAPPVVVSALPAQG